MLFGLAVPNAVNDQEKAIEETEVTPKQDGRVPVNQNPRERGEGVAGREDQDVQLGRKEGKGSQI